MGGCAPLFVWNSVISLSAYWSEKYQFGIQNKLTIYFMVGQLIAYFFVPLLTKLISFKNQIILWPSVSTVLFILLGVFGETLEYNSDTKVVIFFIIMFIMGALNTFLQVNIL